MRKRFPFFGVQLRKPLPHGRGSERRGMLARLGLHFYRAAPLWVIFIAYWIIAITSSINIGHRHLLPVYPPAFMLIGAGAAWWIKRGRRLRLRERKLRSILAKPQAASLVIFGLTGLLAIESTVTWPHYLSYFNQLAGGSRNGYRLLVDSSLDWGQDLPDLRRRIEAFRADPARAGREVYVAYYGSAGLDYWSIDATVIATWPAQREIPALAPPLGAGMYAISATLLQGGPRWSEERDQQYVESERLWRLAMAAQTDPAAREAYEEMVRVHGREAVEQGLAGHRDLRFVRLRAWLRSHRPDSFAGYSILIFDLDNREIEAALYGPIASEPRP